MSRFEIIIESPASTIYRTTRDLDNRDGTTSTRMLAVKTGSSSSEYTPEPHDIVKEARLLTRLVHPNIIDVVHAGHDSQRPGLFSIWLPFVEYTLQDLLDSPLFAPSSPSWIPSLSLGNVSVEDFNIVLESMALQMLSATVFLHNTANSVAHRDIKPGNFLVTTTGCVKLIDFGVAYELSPKSEEFNLDLWPEAPSSLYTQVSTGSYRAPELLFGARDYDPLAVDLWSLGCTIAEFFTPLAARRDGQDEDDSDDDDIQSVAQGSSACPTHLVPSGMEISASTKWSRRSLFEVSRGEIGLAWSIFQIRGTPTESTWPGFLNLPNARRLQFKDADRVPLGTFLPNLPPRSVSDDNTVTHPWEDLVNRLLAYPPSQRMSVKDALDHAALQTEVYLPPELSTSISRAVPGGGSRLENRLRHYLPRKT